MRQAILEGVESVVLRDVPQPTIERPDQVLVRLEATTICGSDVHMFHGRHPPNERGFPSVIGHEGAGVVEAVGAAVSAFKPGDRVATKEWQNGCMADFTVTTPARLLHLPDALGYEQGALLEPLGAVFSLARQCIHLGETVVIVGQGPTGLLFTQIARAAGAAQIIVSEPHAPKRALAAELGADLVIDPRDTDLLEAVRDATHGEMAHAVIEASGSPRVYPGLSSLLQDEGTVGIFATSMGPLPFDFWQLHIRRLQVVATGRGPGYARSYGMGLRLVQRGLVRLEPLITHRLPLAHVADAFQLAAAGREDVGKVAIIPGMDRT
jgi:L-iditol 2-dehydrogenase